MEKCPGKMRNHYFDGKMSLTFKFKGNPQAKLLHVGGKNTVFL
jgi:hypothetical protein